MSETTATSLGLPAASTGGIALRALPKRVPGEVADHVFAFPVTTPVQAARELGMTYKTTSRYLAELTAAGLLENRPVSRFQFYFNRPLLTLLNQL